MLGDGFALGVMLGDAPIELDSPAAVPVFGDQRARVAATTAKVDGLPRGRHARPHHVLGKALIGILLGEGELSNYFEPLFPRLWIILD
jgi:hypothetical protein